MALRPSPARRATPEIVAPPVRIPCLSTGDHGGNCCGIHHISNFQGRSSPAPWPLDKKVERIKEAIDNILDEYAPDGGDCDCDDCARDRDDSAVDKDSWKTAIEIVLAAYQWNEWEEAVLSAGFKKVHEFHNSNSGNTCRVYYITTNE